MLRAIRQPAQFASYPAQISKSCMRNLQISDLNLTPNLNSDPDYDPSPYPNRNANLTVILTLTNSRSAFCKLLRLLNCAQNKPKADSTRLRHYFCFSFSGLLPALLITDSESILTTESPQSSLSSRSHNIFTTANAAL